jgi:hypothetical protein
VDHTRNKGTGVRKTAERTGLRPTGPSTNQTPIIHTSISKIKNVGVKNKLELNYAKDQVFKFCLFFKKKEIALSSSKNLSQEELDF